MKKKKKRHCEEKGCLFSVWEKKKKKILRRLEKKKLECIISYFGSITRRKRNGDYYNPRFANGESQMLSGGDSTVS